MFNQLLDINVNQIIFVFNILDYDFYFIPLSEQLSLADDKQ